jgi:hypothetical protein
MNRFFLAATAAVMAIGVAVPAVAAVNARQVDQRRRIDAGVRSGKLTAHEASVLRREQQMITRFKVRGKEYHNGHQTQADRKRLHHMQDVAERHLDRLKYNGRRGHSQRVLGAKVF